MRIESRGRLPPIDVIEVGPRRDSPALADGGEAIWRARASLWNARLRDHFANPLSCEENDAARLRRDEDRETWRAAHDIACAVIASDSGPVAFDAEDGSFTHRQAP
jgi:hypothetical protein